MEACAILIVWPQHAVKGGIYLGLRKKYQKINSKQQQRTN